jgi:hypothetical protein
VSGDVRRLVADRLPLLKVAIPAADGVMTRRRPCTAVSCAIVQLHGLHEISMCAPRNSWPRKHLLNLCSINSTAVVSVRCQDAQAKGLDDKPFLRVGASETGSWHMPVERISVLGSVPWMTLSGTSWPPRRWQALPAACLPDG